MSSIPPPPPGSNFPGQQRAQAPFNRTQGAQKLLLATGRHRIAALFLEMGLVIVTLGIGWMIWSLVVWGRGQSPAKQILKIRVYAAETGAPANWAHTAIYEFLIGWSVALACGFLNLLTFGIIGSLAYIAVWITDFCWFYKDRNCRTLRDIVCKTLIINIA